MKNASFKSYTEDQIAAARQVDIAGWLQAQGEEIGREGRELYWKRHDSCKLRGNVWHQFSTGKGGNAVDFVMYFYDVPFAKAVEMLLGCSGTTIIPERRVVKSIPKIDFVPPVKSRYTSNIYRYLVDIRRIRADVVKAFVNTGSVFQDAEYGNVVFCGTDDTGKMRFAHKRSLDGKFRRDVAGSSKAYGFRYDKNKTPIVFVFEAPIDMMSFLSLFATGTEFLNCVSLGGTSPAALTAYLQKHPETAVVCLCLDADEAGQNAADRIETEIPEHIHVVRLSPANAKDYNEVEQSVRAGKRPSENLIANVKIRKSGDLNALKAVLDRATPEVY